MHPIRGWWPFESLQRISIEKRLLAGLCVTTLLEVMADFNQDVQLHSFYDSEYKKARKLLGDTLIVYPGQLYAIPSSPIPAILMDLVGDLPMVSC